MESIENDCLCYISIKTASTANEHTAIESYNYINRLDSTRTRKDLYYTGSANLPDFAGKNPQIFWYEASKNETYAGRQGISIKAALPRDLSMEVNKKLVTTFLREITTHEEGKLSVSFAIHHDPEKDNPHFHALIYERPINEISRRQPKEVFFKKANRHNPHKGGAKKITDFTRRDFPKELRELWAKIANFFLEKAGAIRRMNPLSYEERNLDILPTIHLGPRSSEAKKQNKFSARQEYNNAVAMYNSMTEDEKLEEALLDLHDIYKRLVSRKEIYHLFTSIHQHRLAFEQATCFKEMYTLGNIEEDYIRIYKSVEIHHCAFRIQEIIISQLILNLYDKESIVRVCCKMNIKLALTDGLDSEEVYNYYIKYFEIAYQEIFENILEYPEWRENLGVLLNEIDMRENEVVEVNYIDVVEDRIDNEKLITS